jgi:ribosomal protein L29
MKQPVSTKGTNKGKFLLNLPNNQEMNQMSNEELDMILMSVDTSIMTAKGNMSRGLTPPGGNMRELRRTKARILTIKRKRAGG